MALLLVDGFGGFDERCVMVVGGLGVGVEDFGDSEPRGTGGSSG